MFRFAIRRLEGSRTSGALHLDRRARSHSWSVVRAQATAREELVGDAGKVQTGSPDLAPKVVVCLVKGIAEVCAT